MLTMKSLIVKPYSRPIFTHQTVYTQKVLYICLKVDHSTHDMKNTKPHTATDEIQFCRTHIWQKQHLYQHRNTLENLSTVKKINKAERYEIYKHYKQLETNTLNDQPT